MTESGLEQLKEGPIQKDIPCPGYWQVAHPSTGKKAATSQHHLSEQPLSVWCNPEALASPGKELMESSHFSHVLLLQRSGR